MFAILRTGGKQYRVKSGDTLNVELLEGKPGDKITLSDVLMVGGDKPKFGAGSVMVEIVRQFRDEKVLIFKKRRRHNYRRMKGHRQYLTEVKVTDIKA